MSNMTKKLFKAPALFNIVDCDTLLSLGLFPCLV